MRQQANSQSMETPLVQFEAATKACTDAAERNGSLARTGLSMWQMEASRFMSDLVEQNQQTLARLCECRTPLDVLHAEQEWVRARSQSCLESGLRFADAFSRFAHDTNGDGSPNGRVPGAAGAD